jgi:YVTN family beta-propeller protein
MTGRFLRGMSVGAMTFVGLAAYSARAGADSPFTLFESGHVRPLALSPNGKRLFAVNTPDNRLEIFKVRNNGDLVLEDSVPVGLEPVAVAARSNQEVWVVNHLSDSISVVDLGDGFRGPSVARTLLVGDEPRDIVFAGPGRDLAFVTTAHRGQNHLLDPQLTTPGVGRADVWVFDADDCSAASLGGSPLNIITLFSDTPRALAVSPSGHKVYAAAFHSGNKTTVVPEQAVPDGFEAMGGLPNPSTNMFGDPAPETGLIVRHNGAHWVDQLGRPWDSAIKFDLPDKDVFVIDAMADPPVQLSGGNGFYSGVGTVIFNLAVNPNNGKVYASNTEAFNEVRFEGPGAFAGTTVRGHLHESRITVLSPGQVKPRHLNKHIDYDTCCAPVPNAESEKSLAQPMGMAVTSNGAKLYVAAMGSSKVGVFKTSKLEDNSFVPNQSDQIEVSGGGPTGLVLNDTEKRLYVLTRFDNSISVIDTTSKTEIDHIPMHNPEPPSVVEGRRFLYDARFSSAHGDSSCATCHIFGDLDSLGWDLGNPDAEMLNHPGPFTGPLFNFITGQPINPDFHPMKGPTTTQSLRGMANHGMMHWRGDRTGGNDAPTAQPDSGSFDERAGFEKFQAGFVGLLGRSGPIPDADMEAFTDFILQVTYPPNPIRNLDDSLTPAQQAGHDFFFDAQVDFVGSCQTCHTLDRDVNPGTAAPGLFGTNTTASFEFQPQIFKIPHLRNLYQKVGMFGQTELPFAVFPGNNGHQGDQIRGFGFIHDGSFDTVFRFMNVVGFSVIFGAPDGFLPPPAPDPRRRQVEAFMLAFDSNLFPIVGQQVTLSHANKNQVGPRIDLLIERAEEGECDLIAKASFLGHELGYLYAGNDTFIPNRAWRPPLSDALMRYLATHTWTELTYTCVPPGSGERLAIDRDGDGLFDGDEDDCGTDPADPNSN